jgi:hypothetical protein
MKRSEKNLYGNPDRDSSAALAHGNDPHLGSLGTVCELAFRYDSPTTLYRHAPISSEPKVRRYQPLRIAGRSSRGSGGQVDALFDT